MNQKLLASLALIVAAVSGVAAVCVHVLHDAKPSPASDLRAVFAAHADRAKAKRDARNLAAIAGLAAATLEADGNRKQPEYTTAGAANTLRGDLREIANGGLSYKPDYPPLPKLLGDFFRERVGPDDGPLDAARRAKWIEAFIALRDDAGTVADM